MRRLDASAFTTWCRVRRDLCWTSCVGAWMFWTKVGISDGHSLGQSSRAIFDIKTASWVAICFAITLVVITDLCRIITVLFKHGITYLRKRFIKRWNDVMSNLMFFCFRYGTKNQNINVSISRSLTLNYITLTVQTNLGAFFLQYRSTPFLKYKTAIRRISIGKDWLENIFCKIQTFQVQDTQILKKKTTKKLHFLPVRAFENDFLSGGNNDFVNRNNKIKSLASNRQSHWNSVKLMSLFIALCHSTKQYDARVQ